VKPFLIAALFCMGLIQAQAQPKEPVRIWVSPAGSDLNAGTEEQPLASIALAQRKARELRRVNDPSASAGVRVVLADGRYELQTPLFFRAEDSGTAASPTILEAAPGANPLLSGGVLIRDWRQATGSIAGMPPGSEGRVWVAEAPRIANRLVYFRQLWVNGNKAIRARTPNGSQFEQLIGWDRQTREAIIPSRLLRPGSKLEGLEMVLQQQWEIAICRVKSVSREGDQARVRFHEPESQLQFEHPWPQPVLTTNGNSAFHLVNAIEFLDEPGEWFQAYPSGTVYYWPKPGEELRSAEVVAPHLETLIRVEGTLDHPVRHLQLKGIGFAHTTWLRPSEQGHVPLQAGMFLLDAYKLSPKGTRDHSAGLDNQAWLGRPPGAMQVRNASDLRLEDCRFERLGSAGLDVQDGVHDSQIEGCRFRDIGGNGIQLGHFADPGFETHRPYNPADERALTVRTRIANNWITDCANEDWGCVGIAVGYGREITIEHNEVSHLPYTGISVGWGWNKAANSMRDNRILANHIHHVARQLYDTAGIYTLSPQPGTIIASNAVHSIQMSPYVTYPGHWFYLYLDEGSSHITVQHNWCPEERFLKNANGPGNVWTNNGPGVSDEIRKNAGLQPAFRDRMNR
jgi:hypothetical protein